MSKKLVSKKLVYEKEHFVKHKLFNLGTGKLVDGPTIKEKVRFYDDLTIESDNNFLSGKLVLCDDGVWRVNGNIAIDLEQYLPPDKIKLLEKKLKVVVVNDNY